MRGRFHSDGGGVLLTAKSADIYSVLLPSHREHHQKTYFYSYSLSGREGAQTPNHTRVHDGCDNHNSAERERRSITVAGVWLSRRARSTTDDVATALLPGMPDRPKGSCS